MDKTYRIIATKKRSGERIDGITRWDGLSAIHAVDTEDGTKYVSYLDNITEFVEIEA